MALASPSAEPLLAPRLPPFLLQIPPPSPPATEGRPEPSSPSLPSLLGGQGGQRKGGNPSPQQLRGGLESQAPQDSECYGQGVRGPGVPEGSPESRGTPGSEHQGQRWPDNLREVLGHPSPQRALGPALRGQQGEELPRPRSACPCPLPHPPLSINHVYKLWKNRDVLQKKKKNNKKYT